MLGRERQAGSRELPTEASAHQDQLYVRHDRIDNLLSTPIPFIKIALACDANSFIDRNRKVGSVCVHLGLLAAPTITICGHPPPMHLPPSPVSVVRYTFICLRIPDALQKFYVHVGIAGPAPIRKET